MLLSFHAFEPCQWAHREILYHTIFVLVMKLLTFSLGYHSACLRLCRDGHDGEPSKTTTPHYLCFQAAGVHLHRMPSPAELPQRYCETRMRGPGTGLSWAPSNRSSQASHQTGPRQHSQARTHPQRPCSPGSDALHRSQGYANDREKHTRQMTLHDLNIAFSLDGGPLHTRST